MMIRFCSLLLLLIPACNGPSQHFAGIRPVRVSVDGSLFDVRVRGALAESIRVNPQYAPRLGPLGDQAARAMGFVSGCTVTRILGDQSMQLGELACGGAGRAAIYPVPSYDCMEVPSGVAREDGTDYLDYDCSPYGY